MALTQIDGARQIRFSGNMDLGSNKITGLATPTLSTDATNKAYVDAMAQGIDVRGSVRAATTTNGTLATAFQNASVIDGVTLATGDRILLKNQSTGSQNGIYTVNASGAPTRATDMPTGTTGTTGGAYMFVEEGAVNADTGWILTNNGTVNVGTDSLVFTQFSGVGTYSGTTNRITVSAGVIDIGTDVVTLTGSQALTNKSINGLTVTSSTGTLTIVNGGSLITAGAYATTLTSTGATNVTLPTTGTLATLAGSETLTNKTIVAASNTITTAASGNLTSTSLNAALAELQTDIDTRYAAANFIVRETPSGAVPGTSYTLANTPIAGTEEVYLNGMQQDLTNDYTISGAVITFVSTTVTGDRVRVTYRK